MIDFRYHVVSLVSVFLALAVGIVLGAGPLNEGISTGITDQVNQLTSQANQLRDERDEALSEVDAQDSWAQAVAPALVARQLGGRSVAVVELPGADSAQTDEVAEALTSAGATVSSRVTVQELWTDPEQGSARDEAAARLVAEVPDVAPDADADTDTVLARALAAALVTPQLAESLPAEPAESADPAAAEGAASADALLTVLLDAGLVEVEGDAASRGTLALVVAGAPDTDVTDEELTGTADAWRALAAALDAASAGTVLAGPAESAVDGGAVAAVRADDELDDDVSTVDDLDSAVGRVNTVLALREQLSGAAGQYGTTSTATAVVPPLPEPAVAS